MLCIQYFMCPFKKFSGLGVGVRPLTFQQTAQQRFDFIPEAILFYRVCICVRGSVCI